jgi:hypothetical protein
MAEALRKPLLLVEKHEARLDNNANMWHRVPLTSFLNI